MFWVVVDLRKSSKTFGDWKALILKLTKYLFLRKVDLDMDVYHLPDNVNLTIIASKSHSDKHSSGIIWNDKTLNIKWPLQGENPFLISNNHSNNYKFEEFVKKF